MENFKDTDNWIDLTNLKFKHRLLWAFKILFVKKINIKKKIQTK